MKIVLFAYTRDGIQTGKRIIAVSYPHHIRAFAPERICESEFGRIPSPSEGFYQEQFERADALGFISSCGIAVRIIAPFVKNKTTDPAVLCIDDRGQYVISLLSGHIGGANDLAKKIGKSLNALPVITTATDNHKRFSVDSWATRNRFVIDNMQLAKEISATILEEDIPFLSELPLPEHLPNGLVSKSSGRIGIYFGWNTLTPFEKTLRIIPKCLHLGIGCRRGIPFDGIKESVITILNQEHIDIRAVKLCASIDLKAEETGLLEFCRYLNIPVEFYSAEELRTVFGDFSHSDFVQKITGVDNVCERAAMKNADRLILTKQVFNGVTAALGAEIKEVSFE